MSSYTTQLRWIVGQSLSDKGLENTEANWKYIWADLGLNDYPIFSELYRDELNEKIVRHFFMREIGQETKALFTFMLRRTMFEIMPLYNQLYESTLIEIDPLSEWKMTIADTSESEYSNTSTDTSASSNTTNTRNVFQDTPQSKIDLIGSSSIENLAYATNVTYDKGGVTASSNDTSNGSGTNEASANRTESGHHKSESKLLMEWRKSFLNIDMDVVRELEPCFFGLY